MRHTDLLQLIKVFLTKDQWISNKNVYTICESTAVCNVFTLCILSSNRILICQVFISYCSANHS